MAKSDVRERLLAAGLMALYTNGFNATGVQDITDAAEVPKGSFYNHFESKDALGVEVVNRWSEMAAERRRALLGSKAKPLNRLRAHFKSLNELGVESDFETGCLLGNFSAEVSSQSPAIRAALAIGFDRWTAEVAAVIAEAQSEGEAEVSVAPNVLAGILIDAWEGAILRSRTQKSAVPLNNFLAITFNKILT